jgi:hypothetical protein
MKTILFPILGCFLIVHGALAHAQFKQHEPNWSQAAALEAADRAESRLALARLFALSSEGRTEDVLQELEAIEARSSWPLPAREYVLHAFAVGLGDLPSWPGGKQVTDHLMAYSARTLVPDEHHPTRGVPLFNIRAAATGTAMEWRRQAAWIEAQKMFQNGGEAWIAAYLAAGLPERRGFAEALKSADANTLIEIGAASLAALDQEPALAVLAARAGLVLGDSVLLGQALARGDGDGMAQVLREASTSFDENEQESLLLHAIENAKPEQASLAMAIIAPKLLKYPDVATLMFATMEHRELGAAAALVLSGSKDPDIQLQLADLAKRNKGLASQRAALALSDETRNAGGEQQ